MAIHKVENLRFDVPEGFVVGRYCLADPQDQDDDEPYSALYLNKAIVLLHKSDLPLKLRMQASGQSDLLHDLPIEPPAVRIFTDRDDFMPDYVTNISQPMLGEERQLVGKRETFRSESYDLFGSGFISYRFLIGSTNVISVDVSMTGGGDHRFLQKNWYPFIESIELENG